MVTQCVSAHIAAWHYIFLVLCDSLMFKEFVQSAVSSGLICIIYLSFLWQLQWQTFYCCSGGSVPATLNMSTVGTHVYKLCSVGTMWFSLISIFIVLLQRNVRNVIVLLSNIIYNFYFFFIFVNLENDNNTIFSDDWLYKYVVFMSTLGCFRFEVWSQVERLDGSCMYNTPDCLLQYYSSDPLCVSFTAYSNWVCLMSFDNQFVFVIVFNM